MAQIASRRMGVGAQLQCLGCGQTVIVTSQAQAQSFVRQHAQCPDQPLPVDPRYYGAGDLVARVAKPVARRMGMDPGCEPCARRQAALNRMLPRVWRR